MEALLPDDSPAACLGCKYPLRGLTEPRCPECGREFDPGDPKTMCMSRVPGRLMRVLMQPPGWWMHIAVVIAAVLLLVAFSIPGTFSDLLVAGLVCGMALAWLWVERILRARSHGTLSFTQPAIRRRWLTAPTIAVVTILLCWLRAPLYVSFWLSESAMNRTARQVMSLPSARGQVGWIGLYPVRDLRRTEDGMMFAIRPVGHLEIGYFAAFTFTRSCGFAYAPAGPPSYPPGQTPLGLHIEYVHFSGPWWLCVVAGRSGGGNI